MSESRRFGPTALTLREAAALPDDNARRDFLADKLQEVFDQAMARAYINKRGEPVPNPDVATGLKVIETMGRWWGYDARATLEAMAAMARAKALITASDTDLVAQLLEQLPTEALLEELRRRDHAALPAAEGEDNGEARGYFDTTATEG